MFYEVVDNILREVTWKQMYSFRDIFSGLLDYPATSGFICEYRAVHISCIPLGISSANLFSIYIISMNEFLKIDYIPKTNPRVLYNIIMLFCIFGIFVVMWRHVREWLGISVMNDR